MYKVKSKTIKKSLSSASDLDLSDLFGLMLGAGSVNFRIAYPKYLRIKEICTKAITILKMLANNSFMLCLPELKKRASEITEFCEKSEADMTKIFTVNQSEFEWNITMLDDEKKLKFSDIYSNVRTSELVKTLIIICDKLVVYKKNIEDENKLNDKFILNDSSMEITPFPFSKFNIKYIWFLPQTKDNIKKFILLVLHKLFTNTYQLYKDISSPDIDVKEFSKIIAESIDKIRRLPGLHRCDKAFDKLIDSVYLLEENFHDYYRDFISTRSTTTIMENFIIDVSRQTGGDLETARLFRLIISYYKKLAGLLITNPKVKELFDKVSVNLNALDEYAGNLSKAKQLDVEQLEEVLEEVEDEEELEVVEERDINEVVAEIESIGKKKKK